MSATEWPLELLYTLPPRPASDSLGDHVARHVADAGRVGTLLDCLCSSTRPALWSPDLARPPIDHRTVRQTVASFALPVSQRAAHRPLQPNDRVMLLLPTGPENAVVLMALATYHTCAPLNAACTAGELHDDAVRLQARAVVTTRDAVDRLDCWSLYEEQNMEIIVVDFNTSGPAGLFEMAVWDGHEFVHSRRGSMPPCRPNGLSDHALVLHTSGTSGKKKVVPYTLRHMIIGTCCVVMSWELKPDSVNMNMMPLFHVGGIVRNLWSPLFSHGSAIMCAGFDAATWWKLAGQLGATWYYAAPTMHHAILSSMPEGTVASRDTKIRMICNAAGGLLPSLAVQLKETFGGSCAVLPSYGMTECMPIASPPTDYQLDRPGCSGVACGPHLSIRNPFNLEEEMPVGQTGAVSVRGLPTFSGYEVEINGQLDSSSFSKEGWFDSGDMGHMDKDGYLFITGRSKEIINKGGEVISPFEVEEAITQAATGRVKNTLCFSIEHDVLQETIGVVIVPMPNEPRVGLSELQNMLRNYLHPSKWPFAIVYMDDIPKNQAGKPLRIKLGSRLGIGPLTDGVPPLKRHFEADVPGKEVPLSEPIPCKLVDVDVRTVERACYRIPGIVEAAVRLRQDGSPEAFIYVEDDMPYDAADVDRALAQILDGYVVPNPLHVFRQKLARMADGLIDFDTMEAEVRAQNAQDMSRTGLIVRDIIGKLLEMDPGSITADSDFFLLGGNSLLLGRLVAFIRKETGVSLESSSLFTNSTVEAIAEAIDLETGGSDFDEDDDLMYDDEKGGFGSSFLSAHRYEDDDDMLSHGYKPRSQNHPWVMFIQLIPLLLFYPFKAAWTWTVLLHGLAFSAYYIEDNFWERVGVLLLSLFVARLTSRIICPVTAIAFKWLVIGRYRPGKYPMWCNYHLRWWIVNQSLTTAGKGLFNLTPELRMVYYRLLGATIGRNVKIDKFAKLGEYDLLTFHDGVQIDKSVVRGFCVERDGHFRLEPIIIGRDCVINTYTQISPGARLADGTVWGPQSSSHEEPSSDGFASYNRTSVPKPHWALILFVGLPLKLLVWILCYIPWFAALFMLLSTPFLFNKHDALKGVVAWFSYPRRIGWHYVARIVRNGMPALSNIVLGILFKRVFGVNKEGSMRNATQLALWRRWLQQEFLSQPQIRRAMSILGTHHEMTSVIYRAMGAKVGRRVYWPGSGIYCPDPELLEIGDDVVFGSRSEVFTSDSIGWAKVRIGGGAMIADRVVLSPGASIGRQCVMGSGALARRNGTYEPLSVWMGAKHGEAVSFGHSAPTGKTGPDSGITPFGRAFYKRQATFFVIPYPVLVLINIFMVVVTAAYWASPAVVAITFLNFLRMKFENKADGLFGDHWYRPALLYIYIALMFVIVMGAQMLIAFAWVIGTKWAIIGRRHEGRFDWDQSSYCQRWQLHLVLQKLLGKGFGGHIIGCISGTVYAVWYLRALGSKIGRDCAIWAGGRPTLQVTEPELVSFGNHVSIDDCSVVAHINSRGRFSLNALHIGHGCAMRTGSRLLSGASMEPHSMLLEHTLVASGEIAEAGSVYAGWPARKLRVRRAHTTNKSPAAAGYGGSDDDGCSGSRAQSYLPMLTGPDGFGDAAGFSSDLLTPHGAGSAGKGASMKSCGYSNEYTDFGSTDLTALHMNSFGTSTTDMTLHSSTSGLPFKQLV